MGIQVNEAYREWEAPPWVRPTVCDLLASIDERYLRGLEAVVLTNVGALTHDRKKGKTWSRDRKVPLSRCLGLYHRASRRNAAWVELFVDQMLEPLPEALVRVALVRELTMARTLYHELGHHIHATQAPAYRDRESVAETWSTRLRREGFRRRHPYLFPVMRFLRPVLHGAFRAVRWYGRKSGRIRPNEFTREDVPGLLREPRPTPQLAPRFSDGNYFPLRP